MQQKKQQN